MELLIWFLIFVTSLAILVKSADYFTDAAIRIGLFLGLPTFIIGVTIIAIGTSLPELISSIISVFSGYNEIVAGNVFGSNAVNIFLILGIVAIYAKRIEISYELINVDIPLFISSAFYIAIASFDGEFTTGEGILGIVGLIIYFLYAVESKRKTNIKEDIKETLQKEKQVATLMKREEVKLEYFTVAILVSSLITILISAKFTIDSVIRISEILNIGKEVIALTAVSLGTSLPELVVNFSAVKQKQGELVIGSILGSNIFNSFAVMGIPSLVGSLTITQEIITFGIPMMLIATLLFFFKIHEKQITHWEGWMLVIFYFFFIGKAFNLI